MSAHTVLPEVLDMLQRALDTIDARGSINMLEARKLLRRARGYVGALPAAEALATAAHDVINMHARPTQPRMYEDRTGAMTDLRAALNTYNEATKVKKLYRVTVVRELTSRERKHTAPVYLVVSDTPEQARELARAADEQSHNVLRVGPATEVSDAVIWTYHKMLDDTKRAAK